MYDDTKISEEIEELSHQIKELMVKRAALKRKRPPRERFPECLEIDLLLELLTVKPGIDRKGIEEAFPLLKPNEVTSLLTKARRNRGLIENRGIPSRPAWFLIERNDHV